MKTWKKTILLAGAVTAIGLYELKTKLFEGPSGRLRKALFYTSLGTLALYSTYSEEIDTYFQDTKDRKEQYLKQIDSLQNIIDQQYREIRTLEEMYKYSWKKK